MPYSLARNTGSRRSNIAAACLRARCTDAKSFCGLIGNNEDRFSSAASFCAMSLKYLSPLRLPNTATTASTCIRNNTSSALGGGRSAWSVANSGIHHFCDALGKSSVKAQGVPKHFATRSSHARRGSPAPARQGGGCRASSGLHPHSFVIARRCPPKALARLDIVGLDHRLQAPIPCRSRVRSLGLHGSSPRPGLHQ